MLKRPFLSMLVACAVLLLLDHAAVAQPVNTLTLRQQNGISSLTSLFKRGATPAHVRSIEGPTTLVVGEVGAFSALANIETASLPLRAHWDFGDGTTASSLSAKHAYAAPGTYRVLFSLSNDFGADRDSILVKVVAPSEAPPASQGAVEQGTSAAQGTGLLRREDRR